MKNKVTVLIGVFIVVDFYLQCVTTDRTTVQQGVTPEKEYIFSVRGDSVTFAWSAPQNDSVKCFQLFYRTKSDVVWNKIPTRMEIPYLKNPKVKIARNEIPSTDTIFYIGVVSVFNNGKKSLLHKSTDSLAYPSCWALYWTK
jgi:hypothetical protein